VRIDEATGVAEVIVPDYQLSLAIGKEGQNARLAARLTGWRVDIKSETQLVEEEAYSQQDWAEGEWVVNAETGEQVWQPAEGGPAVSAEEWEAALAEAPGGNGEPPAGDSEAAEAPAAENADADVPADDEAEVAGEGPAGDAPADAAAAVEVPAEGGGEPRADEE
jgi:transcription termination/antitermination protein NusA